MRILEKHYQKIFNFFLIAIAITLIFRRLSTILIVAFILFNFFLYKKLKFEKKNILILLIISSPFLLDIIFFWNNDYLIAGLKSAEKRLSLLFLPLIILNFDGKIDIDKFLRLYVNISISVLVFLLIRYLMLYPDNVSKYISGIHIWEMGYMFASSFNMHAPALNMHVSFISVSALYLILLKDKFNYSKIIQIIFFFISLFFLLIINTRVALLTSVLGYMIVFIYKFKSVSNNYDFKKVSRSVTISIIFIVMSIWLFAMTFPYVIHKYTKGSFSNIEMVGRLDEFKNPEKEIYNKLVTRLTIWKSAYELSKESIWIGFGASDSKKELNNYYNKTNQLFLARNKFPTHNQYLDFVLKFGILGLVIVIVYIFTIGNIGFKLKNPVIISFFTIFFICNLTDDFLIRYDGITFSGLWFSLFAQKFKTEII